MWSALLRSFPFHCCKELHAEPNHPATRSTRQFGVVSRLRARDCFFLGVWTPRISCHPLSVGEIGGGRGIVACCRVLAPVHKTLASSNMDTKSADGEWRGFWLCHMPGLSMEVWHRRACRLTDGLRKVLSDLEALPPENTKRKRKNEKVLTITSETLGKLILLLELY